MIRDVKSYFSKVGERLTHAFDMYDFDHEDEAEFWALAADLCARAEVPSFSTIANWIDLAFKAPVHIVYRKEGEKLLLFRQHVISENTDRLSSSKSGNKSAAMRDFNDRLANIETKLKYSKLFHTESMIAFTVGKCQAFPLFKDKQFWGIYCVGPYIQMPDNLKTKSSILSKIVSKWLVQRHQEQKERRYKMSARVEQSINHEKDQGNEVENTAHYLLSYLLRLTSASGAVLLQDAPSLRLIQNVKVPGEVVTSIRNTVGDNGNETFQSANYVRNNNSLLSEYGIGKVERVSLDSHPVGVTLYLFGEDEKLTVPHDTPAVTSILESLRQLVEFDIQSTSFNDQLISSYYVMIRDYERSSDKTKYHSSRMLELCRIFSGYFDLNEQETALLLQTAKLHDIGYISSNAKSIGLEIEHPSLGELMLKNLKLPDAVTKGVAAHHEWVDGSGTPSGLKDDEIPWTAKVIAIFEYIVNFIEDTIDEKAPTEGERAMQTLKNALVTRAGREFDMLIIPTVINMLEEIGWDESCKLGTHDED